VTAPDAAAIVTMQLSKRYGPVEALDRIDLTVPNGVTFGFLGPNGAGKTTLIRLLLGFIRPTAGQARIHGHDCWHEGVRARADVGFLVPADAFYPDMTGAALLDYMAQLSARAPRLRHLLLEALELGQDALERKVNTYSKGMKQKLALSAAIQTAPALLILDEPSDGLDPLIQRAFEQVLTDVHRQGSTIFMSSHDLGEIERICEHVAIVREGRLVAQASLAELPARRQRHVDVIFSGEPPLGLDRLPGVSSLRRDGSRITFAHTGSIGPLLEVLAARDDVVNLLLSRPSLEDIFLSYYGGAVPAHRDASHLSEGATEREAVTR
jgi:ABC-2 type transport system ATP-binding protein